MRQIVLDTETTGREINDGNRILEIGCVELVNRRITQHYFHYYINPQRDSEAGALAVHGLTTEFLADKPLFKNIIEDFLKFIEGAELIIHNAAFDLGFLNHELSLANKQYGKITDYCTVLDTLRLARQLHPGQRNSLDALCKRYEIDNSQRELHGALLDAELLARVYLAMTGGQTTLFADQTNNQTGIMQSQTKILIENAHELPTVYADANELEAHMTRLAAINKKAGKCLWQTML